MVPDDRYACMVYFEDLGITRTSSRTRGVTFTSRLRLVCWINTARLGGDAFAGDKIAQAFVGLVNYGPYNTGSFTGVRHRADVFPQRGATIFSPYTYPEAARQYLMPPFDAFAIEVLTEFRVRPGCEEEVLEQAEDCWEPPVIITPTPPDTSCRYLRVCGTPEVGDVATWDGDRWVPQAPTGGTGDITFDIDPSGAYLLVTKNGTTTAIPMITWP
jgi:hypothetical protein